MTLVCTPHKRPESRIHTTKMKHHAHASLSRYFNGTKRTFEAHNASLTACHTPNSKHTMPNAFQNRPHLRC